MASIPVGVVDRFLDSGIRIGTQQERAACAALVRAAGCACWDLGALDSRVEFEGTVVRDPDSGKRTISQHDPRCPEALAAAIEGRGR